jgi:hypothetical protein
MFSAKLLFQFRVDIGGASGKFRTCEERTIVFAAATASRAVSAAHRKGRSAEFSYENDDGNPVHFEFVGVLDILAHGPEMEDGTVWYDIGTRLLPSERRALIVPSDETLLQRASGMAR